MKFKLGHDVRVRQLSWLKDYYAGQFRFHCHAYVLTDNQTPTGQIATKHMSLTSLDYQWIHSCGPSKVFMLIDHWNNQGQTDHSFFLNSHGPCQIKAVFLNIVEDQASEEGMLYDQTHLRHTSWYVFTHPKDFITISLFMLFILEKFQLDA